MHMNDQTDQQDNPDGLDWADAEVLQFEAPKTEVNRSKLTPFRVGDDPTILVARLPKSAVLINMVKAADDPDPLKQAMVVEDFMDGALLPDSAAYLRRRFTDPDDDWDYDVLIPIINQLKERWGLGPTGSRTGSAKPPARRGGRSTGSSRSRG